MESETYAADSNEVRGIVEVEEPLHSLPRSSPAVVVTEEEKGKEREHLQNSVDSVEEKKIDESVDECSEDDVDGLFSEVSPVVIEEHGCHHRYARPVGGEAQDVGEDDYEYSYDGIQVLLEKEYEESCDCERPHHARAVEEPERHIVDSECEAVREVRDDSEEEKPQEVFSSVTCVVAAF